MAGRRVNEYRHVWCGPVACMKLVQAFVRAPSGFDLRVDIGTSDGARIVLVSIEGTNCAFDPDELLLFSRSMIDQADGAKRLGASPAMVSDVVTFARSLIEYAEEAKTVSPHGLH